MYKFYDKKKSASIIIFLSPLTFLKVYLFVFLFFFVLFVYLKRKIKEVKRKNVSYT